MGKKYYITTAITYTSGKPHIGNTYEIVLSDFLEGFVRQPEHFEVGFQVDAFPEIRKVVEKVGVFPRKENGHDVALVLHGFGDEALLPGEVAYFAFDFAAAQPGGEHNHLAGRGVCLFDGSGGFPRHCPVFVDGEEDVVQVFQVQEQVVDREFQVGIALAEEGDEYHAVRSSQRVVGGKDVASFRRGEVFFAPHIVGHAEVFHHAVRKVQPFAVAVFFDEFVDAVLVYQAFEERIDKARNHPCYPGVFVFEYLFDVNRFDALVIFHIFWFDWAKLIQKCFCRLDNSFYLRCTIKWE